MTPFLESTIIFSATSPSSEKQFREEIWGCHKQMNFSMTDLFHMPIQERKHYIYLHNKEIDEMNSKLKQNK